MVPITIANEKLDQPSAKYKPLSIIDEQNWKSCELCHLTLSLSENILMTADDAKTYHGAPVGLQIIGNRMQEEELIALAEVVIEALRSQGAHPRADRTKYELT